MGGGKSAITKQTVSHGENKAKESATSAENEALKAVREKQIEYAEKKFPNMEARPLSNNYWTMNRIGNGGNTVVVRVGDDHIEETKYGYALVLDNKHVVFLKSWQVNKNYFGNEVMLNKQYFNVREWGAHEAFGEYPENLTWERWYKAAQTQQDAGTAVRWEKTAGEKTMASLQKQRERKKRR